MHNLKKKNKEAKIYSQRIDKNMRFFFNKQYITTVIVEEIDDDEYVIYNLKTPAALVKHPIFQKIKKEFVEVFEKDLGEKEYKYLIDKYNIGAYYFYSDLIFSYKMKQTSFDKYMNKTIQYLTKAFLKVYNKDVLKEYSNIIIKKKTKVSKAQLFKYMYTKEKLQKEEIIRIFGDVDLEDIKIKHNKWNIMVDDDIKVDIKEFIKMIDLVEQRLGDLKTKLAYGDLTIMKHIKGNVVADISLRNDSIRVKYLDKYLDKDVVLSILHELGHRYFKDLKSDTKIEINRRYNNEKNDRAPVERNEPFDLEDGTFKVIDVRRTRYLCEALESKSKKVVPGKRYLIDKDEVKGSFSKSKFFVSTYARKNYEEFFCELFSYYKAGKANQDIKEWMKELIG